MNIAIIGTGYVGLVSGACFAEMGNKVVCVDTDEAKVQKLCSGIIPIYEPGLADIVNRCRKNGNLSFTGDISEAMKVSDICFIAVGTPMGEDGSADTHYVLQVAKDIGRTMRRHMIIVDKSTVPVGTAALVKNAVQEQLDIRGLGLTFEMVSNPEFLKEGSAVTDSLYPDRVVIGVETKNAESIMRRLYKPFCRDPESLIIMDIPSAEMAKYAANCMLATKISFINEMSRICELAGADVNSVRRGIGSDTRIGFEFINPGCGYGGSCFPKDVRALIKIGDDLGYDTRILKAVENVNNDQKKVVGELVCRRFGEDLSGLCFAVWGLSFKPNTDDMRCAPSIDIINELTKRGATVKAYDPKAVYEARECYLKGNENVIYCDNKYDCPQGADALILVTEWGEFKSPDFEKLRSMMNNPVIFDGRNIYSDMDPEAIGFEYYQIGVAQRKRKVAHCI